MRGDFKKHFDDKKPPAEAQDDIVADSLAILRPVFAFAGMGALIGLLLGGTTVGFPISIASTIIGAIGGGILGKFLRIDD